jgi:uncharacterized membrane protein
MFRHKFELAGLGIAATGIAHFIAPSAFEAITKPAFPKDTDKWIMRNGASETAIGTLITLRPTRRLGFAALAAYVGWLGFNGAKSAA